VLHKPHVAIRAHPSTDAELLTLKETGSVVKVEATRGEWVKLAASEIPAAMRGYVACPSATSPVAIVRGDLRARWVTLRARWVTL
jgi:hypothetical protein